MKLIEQCRGIITDINEAICDHFTEHHIEVVSVKTEYDEFADLFVAGNDPYKVVGKTKLRFKAQDCFFKIEYSVTTHVSHPFEYTVPNLFSALFPALKDKITSAVETYLD